MFRQRFTVPLIALLIVSLAVPAQIASPTTEKVDMAMMNKIRKEGLENSQVMNTLSWLTDVHGPRLTGSPKLKAANEWTKAKLTEWGLQNAQLEAWGPFGRGWSLERFSAHALEPTYFPLQAFPKAWSFGTSGPVIGEVVMLDIKTEADLEKYRGKLKGAIVFTQPMRVVEALFKAPGARFTDEQLLAMANASPVADMGASGSRRSGGVPNAEQTQRLREQAELARKRTELLRTEGIALLVDPSTRGDGGTLWVQADRGVSRDKNSPPTTPSIVMGIEHYGRLTRLLEKGMKVKLEIDLKVKFHDDDVNAYNTVAEIPGTDLKDELVMVGGHLDSWHGGTGATDNAAGCAVGMEAVRILQALGVKPRRTIRIALWSGEEQGLLGSRAYVNQHFAERKTAPGGAVAQAAASADGPRGGGGGGFGPQGPIVLKPDHAKFSAYFNLDNGTGKIRGVFLQGNEAVRPIFRAWLDPFRDLGAATLTINNTGGTDHQSFDGVGLPGFQFIQDPVEYDTRTHHSNMDVYERIQEGDMKQASVIMAAFLYNAAMRDEKLPRKPLPPNTEDPSKAAAEAAAKAAAEAAKAPVGTKVGEKKAAVTKARK